MIFRFSKQVLYRFYTGFISMVSIYQQIFVKLKGGGNALKYVKQPERRIVPDDFERRAPVKGINEYRKQVVDETKL